MRHQTFERGSEIIHVWYDKDDMVRKAELWRDGELASSTESFETVRGWFAA